MATPIYCLACGTQTGNYEDLVAMNMKEVTVPCSKCGMAVIYTFLPPPVDEAPPTP